MNDLIHVRYVTFTTKFHKILEELGFILNKKESNNTEKIFYKGNKKIISKFDSLALFDKIDRKSILIYNGLTVSEDTLKFFSSRKPTFIKS